MNRARRILPILSTALVVLLLASPLARAQIVPDDSGTPVPDDAVSLDDQTVPGGLTGNPWGCVAFSETPHESTDSPGWGWINGKSHTKCTTAPPSSAQWTIYQDLFRSSWSGWRRVAGTKTSTCPQRAGAPTCYAKEMIAYISWDCPTNTWYNYRLEADHYLVVNGVSYYAPSAKQSGNWNDPGTVYCHSSVAAP